MMMMRSALYQTNTLSWIFIVLDHGNNSGPTLTHYPDSKPTSFCSFSLMLRDQRRSNKYYFIVFGLTRQGLIHISNIGAIILQSLNNVEQKVAVTDYTNQVTSQCYDRWTNGIEKMLSRFVVAAGDAGKLHGKFVVYNVYHEKVAKRLKQCKLQKYQKLHTGGQ